MGGSSKAPKAPDYMALSKQDAAAQQALLEQQTRANRPTINTPYGSVSWSQDDKGNWTQNTNYDPRIQGNLDALLNSSQQATQDLANQGQFDGSAAGQVSGVGNFDPYQMTSGMFNQQTNANVGGYGNDIVNAGDWTGGAVDVGGYTNENANKYTDAYIQQVMNRLQPQQARESDQLSTKLRLQGLTQGTSAYDTAMRNMLTSQGDVNTNAVLAGMLQGNQESRADYNTNLQGLLSQADNSRSNYNTNLQGQLARSQDDQSIYNTNLQGLLSQAENNRADYNSSLAGDAAYAANNAQNQNQGIATANQQNQAQQQRYNQLRDAYDSVLNRWTNTNAALGSSYTPDFSMYGGTAGQGTAPSTLNAAQQAYAQQVSNANANAQKKSSWGQAAGSVVGGVAGGMMGGPAGAYAGATAGGAAGGALFSDKRMKANIQPINDEGAFKELLRIVPVEWNWKHDGTADSGVLAQQIANRMPHLVQLAENGYLKVSYTGLFALLQGAFRHLAKELEK